MKPNFALSLSFDGIKLLHRAAGGWREVGEVSVTSEDLAGELAMLRKTAASLEPGGVRSKLLIPASQVKYLTLETAGLSDAARRKAAETALHDATPYEIAELAYDISKDGANTHVAAVARETLAEAEAFATEHRFHPVSFVAVPGDAAYLGEPFFGATAGAAALLDDGDAVEPDGIAVVVVGAVAPQADAQPVLDLEPEDTPDPIVDPTEDTSVETSEAPAPQPEEPAEEAPADPEAVKSDATASTEEPPREAEPQKVAAPAAEEAPLATAEPEQPKPIAADAPLPKVKTAEPQPSDEPTKEPIAAQVSASATEEEPKPVMHKAEPVAPEPELVAAGASPADVEPELDLPAEGDARVVAGAPAAPKVAAPGDVPAATAAALAAAVAATPSQKPTFSPTPPAPAPAGEAGPSGFSSRRGATGGAAKPLGGAQRIAVATPVPDSSSLTQEPPVADTPAPVAAKTGFFSRRKPRTGAAAPVPAPTSTVVAAGTEAERMTVFGARSDQVGGKPRFLGLIMTVVLLVFLAGVAAWAAVFLDEGIAGLMKDDDTRTTASAPENQIDPEIIRTPEGVENTDSIIGEGVQVAALDPVLSAEDAAVIDALQDPLPEPVRPVITEQEAAARYAVTGIWPLAPDTPLAQRAAVPEPAYRSSLDAPSNSTDAIALPAPNGFETDVQLAAVISPPPFGQVAALDANGLLVPSPTGVVTPGGYTLIAASPPIKPPLTLTRFATRPEVIVPEAVSPLAGVRPQNRPKGLAERTERVQLGGVSRIELAAFRPSLRPRSLQDRVRRAEEAEKAEDEAKKAAEAERATAAAQAATAAAAAALAVPQPDVAPTPDPVQNATKFATARSIRPDTRPRNFARIVKRAQREAPKETRVAAAASVAPRTVSPKVPSKASVARSATVKNAINLRKVNLIGVYGKPSSRRALVRLSNGRYKKVRVGDRIDGGRVSAISNSELRYKKSGRNVVLKMP